MSFFGPKNIVLAISPSYGLRSAQPRTLFWDFGTFWMQWQCLFDLILITKFFAAAVCVSDLSLSGIRDHVHGEESFRARRRKLGADLFREGCLSRKLMGIFSF